ncbi:microcin C ABC transporter permease YejB [Rhodospirillaceae bacterium KN72]|uniref:Microcin C ABC transporter permease YejB n=1 Tax=Pacificispira spongiicola TaxID=2729598 RepID=A0A7Y0DYA9_9PROT|nr:microcin C ABC transporter permease YejB [Pacificispira spongiicola]NMM43827.1 microcin C ABC transporter permease YejB [Pacificispira spongiicola]
MYAYIVKRLLLIVPTLFVIMAVNFVVIQAAPGGPIDQIIAQLKGEAPDALQRVSGGGADIAVSNDRQTRASRGLPPEFIAELEQQFGFDKPMYERFFDMVWNYLRFDFGDSYFADRSVIGLVLDKLPVSISLGLWTTVITYLVAIPLGIAKAVREGSKFDIWTSAVLFAGYALPNFLFAVVLIILFAGGQYLEWFPLRGLVSEDFASLTLWGKIVDYFWHLALPLTAMIVGAFTTLAMLTKNSFLDEINKQYVVTARQKGLEERRILYGHVFRNAMLIVIAGFPSAFISILFTSSLLIEVIFSLDGLGALGFEATLNRDYPVMFGTLYMFTLLGLVLGLVGDLMYVAVDPRIDFEEREG